MGISMRLSMRFSWWAPFVNISISGKTRRSWQKISNLVSYLLLRIDRERFSNLLIFFQTCRSHEKGYPRPACFYRCTFYLVARLQDGGLSRLCIAFSRPGITEF